MSKMVKCEKWSFRDYIRSTFEDEWYDASLKDLRTHTYIINNDFITNKRNYCYNYGDLKFLRTEMQKYVTLDTILYNSVIKFGVHNKFVKIQEIQEIFDEMKANHIKPTIITYTTCIKAFDNAENYGKVQELFNEMKANHIQPTAVTYNTCIKAFDNAENYGKVQEIFDEMKANHIKPTDVTYSTCIKAFDNAGNYEKIQELFDEMKANHIKPTDVTYTTCIKAFDNAENYGKVQELFDEMKANKMLYTIIKTISKTEIDIHGMSDILLKYYLKDIKDDLLKTKQFKIICGRGLHSDNGAVLKPIIQEFCKKHHLLYKIDSRGGRIITNP